MTDERNGSTADGSEASAAGETAVRTDATRSVEIPERIADRLERRAEDGSFDSVDEYATLALRLLLRELDTDERDEIDGDAPATGGSVGADREDSDADEAVRDRLDSLGYL